MRAVCQQDDQCRGSSVKEKDHLAGKLTNLYCAIGPIFSVYGQRRLEDICSAPSLPHCHTHMYSHASSWLSWTQSSLSTSSQTYLATALFHKMTPFIERKCAWNNQIVKIPATTLQTCQNSRNNFADFLEQLCKLVQNYQPGSSSLRMAISIVFFGPIFKLVLSISGSRLTCIIIVVVIHTYPDMYKVAGKIIGFR